MATLLDSGLENRTHRGSWQAAVCRFTESDMTEAKLNKHKAKISTKLN